MRAGITTGSETGLVARNRDLRGEVGCRETREHAAGRRDVGVVSAHGDPHVAVAAFAVVGWIEAGPSTLRQPALHPCVTLARDVVLGTGREVAGHVARRDPPSPGDRCHHVGVVLADSAPRFQDAVDRGVGCRAPRHVLEDLVEAGLKRAQARQPVAPGGNTIGGDEARQGAGGWRDETAGLQHQPPFGRGGAAFPGGRRAGLGGGGQRSRAIDRHPRASDDPEPGVRPGAIEEVAPVAVRIGELRHGAVRIGLERKALQCLMPIHERGHEQGQDRAANRPIIAVQQLMLDRVKEGHDGNPSSTG